MDDNQNMSEFIICTAIVISAFCAKAPQILQVLENKSAEGINLGSVSLDLVSLTIFTSYLYSKGHPFPEYGDSAASAFATFVLSLEVLFFDNRPKEAVFLTIAYAAAISALISGAMPLEVIVTLECIMIPVNLSAKLMQACTNLKEGGTGQISGVTTLMMFCGSLVKAIGIYQSSGDRVLIANALASVIGNGVIGIQIFYYGQLEFQTSDGYVATQ